MSILLDLEKLRMDALRDIRRIIELHAAQVVMNDGQMLDEIDGTLEELIIDAVVAGRRQR